MTWKVLYKYMAQKPSRHDLLLDEASRAELVGIGMLMAECLERLDRLGLSEIAAHVDLALARFERRYPVGEFLRRDLDPIDTSGRTTS